MPKRKKKTKEKGRVTFKNGITLSPDISLSLNKEVRTGFYTLIQYIITVFASLGTVFMLEGFFKPDNDVTKYIYLDYTVPIFLTIFLTAICVLLLNSKVTFLKITGAVYLVGETVFVLSKLKHAVNGIILVINYYTENAHMSKPWFAGMAAEIAPSEIDIFFISFAFIVTLTISLACIYRVNFPILFIATFPVFEAGTFWGWNTYPITVVLMLSSWVTVLSLNMINYSTRKKKSINTFALYAKKKSFYLTNENIKKVFFSNAGKFLALIIGAALLISCTFVLVTDNYRPERFTKLRKDISNGFENYTYELSHKAPKAIDTIPGRTRMVGGTNGGQLGLYDKIEFNGSTSLRVNTDKFSKPLYLRGYSGEKYENNCWNPVKTNENIIDSFYTENHYPSDYNFIMLDENEQIYSARHNISVKTINANKDLIYAPYGTVYAACDNVKDEKYSGMLSSEKTNTKYQLIYDTVKGSNSDFTSYLPTGTVVQLFNQYGYTHNNFTFYEDWVNENADYTDVPETLAPLIDDIIVKSNIMEYDSPEDIQIKIKEYFKSEGFTYDMKPGVTPEENDFIEYFLTNQKKGYCTYYASVGVMIMRRLGYPARYIEGYLIEPSQYREGEEIRVSDRCAHAWCEIFIDYCGWIPLEFTLGYEDDNPNLTDEEKNIQKDESSVYKNNNSSESESSSKPKNSSSDKPDISSKPQTKSSSDTDSDKTNKENSSVSDSSATDNSNAGVIVSKNGKGGSGDNSVTIDVTKLLYISGSILFVILFIFMLNVRHKHELQKLENSINDIDYSSAVTSCYKTYLRYLQLLGINVRENVTDTVASKLLLKQIKDKIPELSEGFSQLFVLSVAAYMGNNKITEEDADNSRKYLLYANSCIYEKLSTTEKLIAKWINNLY